MIRIILKNGDILEYPDATIAKTSSKISTNGYAMLTNKDEETVYAVFNVNNIAGWDYGNIL